MADYAYDKDFLPFIPELPTVADYSTAEKIQAVRAERDAVSDVIPPRDGIDQEDRMIPGLSGAPARPRLRRPFSSRFPSVMTRLESAERN